MGFEFIRVEKEAHIITVTIERPEVMNALHPPACRELNEAFDAFSEDPESWVAILTGSGHRAFCAGNDFKWQSRYGEEAVAKGLADLKGGFGGITSRFDCFKPIIAAVNGAALGGGLAIVLACDIVVAAETATFGLPGPRLGTMTQAGGVHRLIRHISFHQAMGLILTGRHISVQEAFRLGMVNRVAPLASLLAAAHEWAEQILTCAPLAVRASKEAAIQGYHLPLREAVGTVFPETVTMKSSADLTEGQGAFAEKRKPRWKGQ